jgi:hypothetical protein
MEEAPQNLDYGLVPCKDDVGRAGQPPAVEAEAQPHTVQHRADGPLGAGVLRADRRHDLAALLLAEHVCHRQASPPSRQSPIQFSRRATRVNL